MANTALVGLPHIVRAGDEVRWRGQLLTSMGVASLCFWTVLWLVNGPVEPVFAGAMFLVALSMALTLGGITSRTRFAHATAAIRRPQGVVHETTADTRERRTKASVVVLLGVVTLLVLDSVVSEVGATAALLAGVGTGVGIVDRLEARRWMRLEDQRGTRVFLMLRPRALLARFGSQEAYELPHHRVADIPEEGGVL
ncbi:MAG: hypothetical protein EXQ74_02935 [Thermoleophilia bacterium]|nr:hypothetical protein [Thermoleophilia bacterium]